NYLAQVSLDESLCFTLVNAAKWTVDMLDLLLRQLEDLCEKSGIPLKLENDPAAANLETVFLRLAHMLKDNGVISSIETPEYDKEHYVTCVSFEIADGVLCYQRTKASDRASALLQVMAQVDDDHEREKKAAEAEGKMLAPSISKRFIEKQIEVVKKFPVEELYVEAEKLVSKICPIEEKRLMGREIRLYITKTNRAMIVEIKGFWQQYVEPSSLDDVGSQGAGIRHDLNGLNKTLDSLLIMVDMFKSQWEKKYDPFVAPFDRSDPKRPRTTDF
ncbi:Unknown protein, partial [Striga hermonthica]